MNSKLATLLLLACVTIGAAQPPAKLRPYETLDDVPRNAWFRRKDKPHLCDTVNWFPVNSVNPEDGSLFINEQYVVPSEMLERWVWTDDPMAKTLVVRQCGK